MGRPEAMEEGVRSCRSVEALKLSTMEPERYVTISIGVYTAVPTDRDSWREMLSRADRALYAAKKGGKNRASYYEENGDNFSTEWKGGNFENQRRILKSPAEDFKNIIKLKLHVGIRYKIPQQITVIQMKGQRFRFKTDFKK